MEYMELNLEEKIERLLEAYDIGDNYRSYGEYSYTYGYEGNQFMRCLAEFLPEIRNEEYAYDIRCSTAEDLYDTVEKHYSMFTLLLDDPDAFIAENA